MDAAAERDVRPVRDINLYTPAAVTWLVVWPVLIVWGLVGMIVNRVPLETYILIPAAVVGCLASIAVPGQTVECTPTFLKTRRVYAWVDKFPGQWFTLWGDIDLTKLTYVGPNVGLMSAWEFRDSDGNVGHLFMWPSWRRLEKWGPMIVAAADRNGVKLDARTRAYFSGDETAINPAWAGEPLKSVYVMRAPRDAQWLLPHERQPS